MGAIMRPLRVWLGSLLLALGVVWVLDAAGVLSADAVISRWWPIAVVALGLLALIGERRLAPGPIVVIVIGSVLLVDQLTSVDVGGIIWGGVVIAIGAWLLIDFARPRSRDQRVSETQDVFALLGGSHGSNRSPHFRHADVLAVLGGATLDLRGSTPAPGARVDALALFGGVDVIVPTGWRVEVSGLPIFGGYQDKTGGDRDLPPDAPQLKVVATALFGGVEVKNPPAGSGAPVATGPQPGASSHVSPDLR
jgi:hypothetical protein